MNIRIALKNLLPLAEEAVKPFRKMFALATFSLEDKEEWDRLEGVLEYARQALAAPDELAALQKQLEETRAEQNIPVRYVKHGGVTYCIWGTSSISAYEQLERKLASGEFAGPTTPSQ